MRTNFAFRVCLLSFWVYSAAVVRLRPPCRLIPAQRLLLQPEATDGHLVRPLEPVLRATRAPRKRYLSARVAGMMRFPAIQGVDVRPDAQEP
jgi:hypothetical protein